MQTQHGIPVWSSPAWLGAATVWADETLAAQGIRRTGRVTQPHLRAWATALVMPTTQGRVWLKATGPGTRFEVPLYAVLHRLVPTRTVEPLGIDLGRGWVLLRDGGAVLGATEGSERVTDALPGIVGQYAQLQLELTGQVDAVLATGIPDHSPQRLPERLDEALDAGGRYAATVEEARMLRRVRERAPQVSATAEYLSASDVRLTLQHDDLHPWNVFVTDPGERARFFDWGDSVVAHPFATMLNLTRMVREMLGTGADDPRITRIRDAYLEPFGGPPASRVGELESACRVGGVSRALAWTRVLDALGPAGAAEYRIAPLRWLSYLLVRDPYGGPGWGQRWEASSTSP